MIEGKLPANVEAERLVLGSILLDAAENLPGVAHLTPADFSLEAHRRIYAVILKLNEGEQAVDRVTVANELNRRKHLESIGGLAYLIWLDDGLPQIYTMESDGTNLQRLTDEGYAVSPSWSPNGQLLAFAWIRHYGPGAPGAQDIYVMDIASKRWIQLTHAGGRNDFPSWSPDGRHLVFQSNRSGVEQIWTMLADGSEPRILTATGANSQPNWSWK